ncbi:MAG: hypothetical protein ACRDJ1_06955, partial [Actinomycetota bacterium]
YLQGASSDRRQIAEATAAWLGFPGRIAHEDEFFPDTATVDLGKRLIEPGDGDEWVLDLDTSRLMSLVRGAGYGEAVLTVCTPAVETRLRASRPPDIDLLDTVCDLEGFGWTLLAADEPLRIRATLIPEPADYLAYAAGTLLGSILLGALAWWIGDRLRRGPFRRRSGASVAIGLIGGGFAAIGSAALTAAIGATAGPADNLALSRDLTLGGFVQSVLYPALIAAAPGIIFTLMLVRRRPWAEEDAPPPMSMSTPGSAGPPPLPWTAG